MMSTYLLKAKSEPAQQKPASSEERQRKIDDVREQLCDLTTEMPGFLSDRTISRFLGAKNGSTAKATKALKDAVKWRRQYKPDKICLEEISDWETDVKRSYIPNYLDKKGRSVFIITPSVKSTSSAKERLKVFVYHLESMAMSLEDTQEDGVVWMCDFRGWTLSSTPLWESRESLHIIQSYYPGLIAAAILNDPPRIFESFWKLIKHIAEPALIDKVKFVYSNNSESQRIISDMFDLDKLESEFGGRNTAGLDITKYAEEMRRRRCQMKGGAWTPANANASSSCQPSVARVASTAVVD
ncbi:hypothetical protein U9M48_009236 [Paspalum notatum var. saurae]|uniref:CRAL-TRIO domain-containing protein n=1 Tax=Paspalum notatum var. saurae TaxID=547442 RepID=A0AAQ3SS96_PASNO